MCLRTTFQSSSTTGCPMGTTDLLDALPGGKSWPSVSAFTGAKLCAGALTGTVAVSLRPSQHPPCQHSLPLFCVCS